MYALARIAPESHQDDHRHAAIFRFVAAGFTPTTAG